MFSGRPGDQAGPSQPVVVALVDELSSFHVLLREAVAIATRKDAQVLVALASWRLAGVVTHETGAAFTSGLLSDARAWTLEAIDALEWEDRRKVHAQVAVCPNTSAVRRVAETYGATRIVVSTSLQALRPALPTHRNIARALCRPADPWSVIAVPVSGAWKVLWRHVFDTERAN